jgi:capsular polysaccharide biosynthesis protein
MLGGILGLGLAFLLENLDDSWRSPEEVELVSGVPTFGVIPVYEFSKGKGT